MTTATTKLHDFEGNEVHRSAVKITGAGDGLSDALTLDNVEIPKHEERYFVIRAKCADISFPTDKKGITTRVHKMSTDDIMLMDDDLAKRMLAANAESFARKKAQVDGQMELEESGYLEGQEAVAQLHEGNGLSPEFTGE